MLTSHVILGLFHLPKTSEVRGTHSGSVAKTEVSLSAKELFWHWHSLGFHGDIPRLSMFLRNRQGKGKPRASRGTSQQSPRC